MKINGMWILSYHTASILIGAFLFLCGFFPITYSNDKRADLRDLPNSIDDIPLNDTIYRSHVSRSILMVIDAFRTDFIQHHQNLSMIHLNKLIRDKVACLVNLEVDVPTVTMPRIKAMTTGTIPNFIDIVRNLGSSELKMDSLLHQVYRKLGNKIVFCGDNTWVKMFPEMFRRKLENEDSFFVNDFYEGDKNITQKLSLELKRDDWKLLILHYLGLDHIGHVEGPFSSKIGPKLREMDTVVMHIHSAMLDWMRSSELPALLMVTGDHGMRDGGGHGGSSYAETNVPLIVIGPSCHQNGETFKQIDMSATISVLLGVPIASSSIGALIPHFLQSLSMEQKLYAHFYNGQRLLQKLIEFQGIGPMENKEFYKQFMSAKDSHKKFLNINDKTEMSIAFKMAELRYITASAALSEQLAKQYVNFDHLAIGLGLGFLSLALCGIIFTMNSSNETTIISVKYNPVISILLTILQPYICTEMASQSVFCTQFDIWPKLLLTIIYTLLLANIQLICEQFDFAKIFSCLKWLKDAPKLLKFVMFGAIFHTISALSSSFIEEEHQIWYYLNSTALVLLYLCELKMMMMMMMMRGPYIGSKTKKLPSNNTDNSNGSPWMTQLEWILLFSGHLIGRRLNQTGDKWLNVPDIGDWLQMDEHRLANSLFTSGSLLLLHISCLNFGSISINVLTMTASILVYYYRTLKGSVHFVGIDASDSTGICILLFWLNIGGILTTNCVPLLYKSFSSHIKRFDVKAMLGTLTIVTILVTTLTHKPHNIFLIALLMFTTDRIDRCRRQLFNRENDKTFGLIIQCVLHLWIGKLFFFYQGNSNSLATIDLNAGYTGQYTFSFMSVAFLLTLNTFSGPILSFLVLIYNLYDCNEPSKRRSKDFAIVLPWIAFMIALPFIVYVFIVLSFRHHIFIWSVFSPKLLYDFYYLCLMAFLWMLTQLVSTPLYCCITHS